VIDVKIKHFVQALEKLIWHEKEVSQTAGLLAEAGEVNGGHG
jgi:hypothetical protein